MNWKDRIRYRCLCCGSYTLSEKPPGTYEVCPVCRWEDDRAQALDPELSGGANALSLNEARQKYLKENGASAASEAQTDNERRESTK